MTDLLQANDDTIEPRKHAEHARQHAPIRKIFAAQHGGVDQRGRSTSYPPTRASMRLASVRGISMKNLALSGRSILVVEDEPLVALDLRQTLESAGAYVFAATQLGHALQLAGHPDLSAAVLDYRLADGDCSPICTLLSERGIPFVFYSGYDDVRQIWPHVMHVEKPAAPQQVVDAIAGALRSSTIAPTARAA